MFKDALKTASRVIFSPQVAWEYISMRGTINLYKKFLIPLWVIIIVSAFIGGLFVSADNSFEHGIKNLIIDAFVLYVGFHMSVFFLNEYAKKQEVAEKDRKKAEIFVAYSSSLIYLVNIIVSILPAFFFLWLFSIYTFYIVYIGAEIYYQIIPEKRMSFMTVATLFIIGIPLILRSIMIT